MKSDLDIMQSVRTAIDDCTRGIEETPSLQQKIVQKVKGEEPVKKKISTALVFALVLVIVSVTALAATLLWQEAGEKVAPLEGKNGYYDTWNTDAKVELVQTLYDLGELKENADAEKLLSGTDMSAEEKDALCDAIMTTYVSGTTDTVTLLSILEKLHGSIDTWSQEDKVWYNRLLQANDMLTDGDENYVLPEGEELTQEQAIEKAKSILISKGAEGLDSATIEATLTEDTERVWSVLFEMNQEGLPYGGAYHVDLTADGTILNYSTPQLVAMYITGLAPDDEAISEEEALAIGLKAIAEENNVQESELTNARAYFGEIDLNNEEVAHAAWQTHLWAVDTDENYYALISVSGEVIYTGSHK